MILQEQVFGGKRFDCPSWMEDSIFYLVVMGSHSYGCNGPDSDMDYYGVAFPPWKYIYPSVFGYINGYDQMPVFDVWTKQTDQVDVTIYGITNYLRLLEGGNPNIIESLFTDVVIKADKIGLMIRDNRDIFISRALFFKLKAFADAQLKRLDRKPEGKRLYLYEKFGYDTKSAGHCIRLLDNCEQLITTGTLNLRRMAGVISSIRNGEYTVSQIREIYQEKELTLEKFVLESNLVAKPDNKKVRELLNECLNIKKGYD